MVTLYLMHSEFIIPPIAALLLIRSIPQMLNVLLIDLLIRPVSGLSISERKPPVLVHHQGGHRLSIRACTIARDSL